MLGTRPNDTLTPLVLRMPNAIYELPGFSRADFERLLVWEDVALAPQLMARFSCIKQQNALYLGLVGRAVRTLRQTCLGWRWTT